MHKKMKIVLIKTAYGFVPNDQVTKEWADKIKVGALVHSNFKKMNNYEFHKKLMKLASVGFEYWEPGPISEKHGKPVVKNFDRYREQLTILAGYYDMAPSLAGRPPMPVAHSWSFGKMDGNKREKFYQDILTTLIDYVFKNYTKEEVEKIADQLWSFA